ncbi:MAG TPA: hypothetical protein VGE85_10795 [Terracidiphilus sp.]|jgi:hypothetical protein
MSYILVIANERVEWPAICACCGSAVEPLVTHQTAFNFKNKTGGGGVTYIQKATGEIRYFACSPCSTHIKYCEAIELKRILGFVALIVGFFSYFFLAISHSEEIGNYVPILKSENAQIVFYFALPFVVVNVLCFLLNSWTKRRIRAYPMPSPMCKVRTAPMKILNWKPFLLERSVTFNRTYLPQAGIFILQLFFRKTDDNFVQQFVSINSSMRNIVQVSDDESQIEKWKKSTDIIPGTFRWW